MKIIRRSGVEDEFNPLKIEEAIRKANNSVPLVDRLSEKHISRIVEDVVEECEELKHSPSVEEVQDMVENHIMSMRAFKVAHNYITYRFRRALVRKSNSTDEQILSL